MTTNEFKSQVALMTESDWVQTVDVVFNFPYVNFSTNIKGLSAVYEYVVTEANGWAKYQGNLPAQFMKAKEYFENIRDRLVQFVNNNSDQVRPQVDHIFNNEVRSHINNISSLPLPYSVPETEFLLSVFTDFPHSFSGAHSFITGAGNLNFGDRDSIVGMLQAYEFTMKDHTQIMERRNAEKLSLSKLRSEFHTYLNTSEEQLVKHLRDANETYTEYVKGIDFLKVEKDKLFTSWFQQTQESFTVFNTDSTKKVTDLQTTYDELLRLKKPADYWRQRAIELKREGWRSLYWLVALVAIGCIALYMLLWLTPEGMLKSFFNQDKSLAVRWSIIFITFISFLFFGIRALMKVTFSSFHLARDAEERERLTYVYLAMIKDTTIEKEDRHLIMQSLFSRADTGLLKDDSSPTMPGTGGLFEKVLSK